MFKHSRKFFLLVLFCSQLGHAKNLCRWALRTKLGTALVQLVDGKGEERKYVDHLTQQLANDKQKGIVSARLILKALNPRDIETAVTEINAQKNTLINSSPDQQVSVVNDTVGSLLKPGRVVDSHGDTFVYFAVYEQGTQKYVGLVGIDYTNADRVFNLAYLSVQDSQKKGYATEAVSALVNQYRKYSDQSIPLMAAPHKNNTASRRVLEKAGFEFYKDRAADNSGPYFIPPLSLYSFPE